MISFPHCKINLGLNITGKRPDGYHDLITCFYPVPLCDILEIIPSATFNFSASGIPVEGDTSDNLCVKAYSLIKTDFSIPNISMHLHKSVPSGAGLGGGSSDAAFTIRMLNEIFQLNLSVDTMRKYASKLGSDCSFFIEDVAMIGSGKGDQLKRITIDLKGKYLIVIKPEIHISTAEAYSKVVPGASPVDLEDALSMPLPEWREHVKNDFEDSVFKKYPEIKEIKKRLYKGGAVYASMSGSGSSVYGIFEKEIDLREQFPGMFYWSSMLDQTVTN